MTQEQVAERLEIDPTFVGRLERGQRGAHWRTIRRILAAVDASGSDFAKRDRRRRALTPSQLGRPDFDMRPPLRRRKARTDGRTDGRTD
jgi:transcriptional regulator with XRE-family HTH domain